MANVAQIKRSAVANHASTDVPTTTNGQLAHGELGWVDGSRQLFIGRNTADPAAIVVEEVIGRAATLSDATVPKRGVACFDSDDFTMSAHSLGDDTGGVVSLKSLTNSHLTNSKFVISDGTETSDIDLGGTLTIAGTDDEITATESAGTVTLSLPSAVSVEALTVTGDLTVSGETTTTLAQTLEIEDKFIMLAKGNTTRATAAAAPAAGLFIQCTTSGQTDPSLYWTTDGWKTDEAFIAVGLITADGGNSGEWNTAHADRLKWDGGSTDLNAATARASLDLEVGVDVQAYDATIVVDDDLGTSALLDTAAVTDGATTTVATGDQIYDFVIALNYITASSEDTLTNKTLASDAVTWS